MPISWCAICESEGVCSHTPQDGKCQSVGVLYVNQREYAVTTPQDGKCQSVGVLYVNQREYAVTTPQDGKCQSVGVLYVNQREYAVTTPQDGKFKSDPPSKVFELGPILPNLTILEGFLCKNH